MPKTMAVPERGSILPPHSPLVFHHDVTSIRCWWLSLLPPGQKVTLKRLFFAIHMLLHQENQKTEESQLQFLFKYNLT